MRSTRVADGIVGRLFVFVVVAGTAVWSLLISSSVAVYGYDPEQPVASAREGVSVPDAEPDVASASLAARGYDGSGSLRRASSRPVGYRLAPSGARHLCSFSGETEVLMADGTTKPISEVEVGDFVLAEDPESGERGAREVTHLWGHQDTIIDLEIDGHDVATTEEHSFWNYSDGEWQRADTLDPGDLVLTADGATLTVEGFEWESRTTAAYNLTVDGIHTYFVEVDGDAVLVHNTGDGRCGLGESIVRHIPENRALNGVSQSGRAAYIDDVLTSDLADHRILDPNTGRQARFDPELENVIIYDPTSPTGGTAFPRPGGRDWFREVLE